MTNSNNNIRQNQIKQIKQLANKKSFEEIIGCIYIEIDVKIVR
jgi:hypothetical protein